MRRLGRILIEIKAIYIYKLKNPFYSMNPWKIGIGTGSILLGIYYFFNQNSIIDVIIGVIAIAFGIGLLASEK